MSDMPEGPETTLDDLQDPIGFLQKEHGRQSTMLKWMRDNLDEIIEGGNRELAQALLHFFTTQLSLHMRDEEQGLFHLLRLRCPPGHQLQTVLSRLSEEHHLDQDLTDFITEDLQALAEGRQVLNPTRLIANIFGFAESQTRHLNWENKSVLAQARDHLNDEDLAELTRHFAEARGL